MVGNVSTSWRWASNPRTIVLESSKDVPRHAVVARAIQERGSLAGIQLAQCPDSLFPLKSWSQPHPDEEIQRLRRIASEPSQESLDEHMRSFVVSARLACAARFDVIQLHAAHGYLLSLLLSHRFNERKDKYRAGGPWWRDLISELRQTVDGRLLSVRLNLVYGLDDPVEDKLVGEYSALLSRLGVDIIDLSAGIYTMTRSYIYPGTREERAIPYFAAASALATELPGTLVSVAGNFRDLRDIPAGLPDNLCVSVGRALIADSRFVDKSFSGDHQAIRICDRRNRCHYFSRGARHLECGVNPHLGTRSED